MGQCECPTYKHSFTYFKNFGKLCISLFTAAHCKRMFLSPRLFIAHVYVHKHKYLENNVIAWPFSKITLADSTLGPGTPSATGFWTKS